MKWRLGVDYNEWLDAGIGSPISYGECAIAEYMSELTPSSSSPPDLSNWVSARSAGIFVSAVVDFSLADAPSEDVLRKGFELFAESLNHEEERLVSVRFHWLPARVGKLAKIPIAKARVDLEVPNFWFGCGGRLGPLGRAVFALGQRPGAGVMHAVRKRFPQEGSVSLLPKLISSLISMG